MNFLTFIFSLLIILSFSTFVTLEKHAGDRRMRSTYLGHITAHRKILSKWESKTYKSLKSVPKLTEESKIETTSKEKKKEKTEDDPKINPECARLNLWPLIQEGRQAHPLLYEMTVKFLKTFYGHALFNDKPQAEALFLDAFLKTAKEALEKKQTFALEKLTFSPSLQKTYYKMLKGTKEWTLENPASYPSFLDVLSVLETPTKICLAHAHKGQIAAFFNPKIAQRLYEELHKKNPILLTKESIENICSECHTMLTDPALFDLLELGRPRHARPSKTTLIAEDKETHISLRKNIYSAPG